MSSISDMESQIEISLKVFLKSCGLEHLENIMLENGMTLEVLTKANENELTELSTRVADKIKLRTGLDKLALEKQSNLRKEEQTFRDTNDVALLVRQDSAASYITENDIYLTQNLSTSTPRSHKNKQIPVLDASNLSKEFSFTGLLENPDELDLILSQDCCQESSSQGNSEGCRAKLYRLLQKETFGKCLLEKAEKGQNLNSRDRAFIVKSVVEAELKCLDKLSNSIRRDIWLKWASAIADCFKGEAKSLYYVPYHVVEGKVIQASGLIHNRLITHRRNLSSESKRKRSNSDTSDSGHSSKSNCSERNKRVRPLPEGFNKLYTESESSAEEQLDWLRGSSSPYDVVISKWGATFELRAKLLESHSYLEYFNTFPALKLPNGYKLLSSDFEAIYPDANKTFEERFPLIKLKLLKLLADRGESSRVDQTTLELLELASVGEEQANLVALLCIVTLMRQMPTISLPKKKVWKLSRDEVRNGFLPRVASSSEIETYCSQRQMLCIAKGIPNQPFILAIGPSWTQVMQYEIVIDVNLRYQLPSVSSAVMYAYNIYWALDCAYPRESTPCWMLIQRMIYQMTSKYDTEGVPLRELIQQLDTN